MGVTPPLSFADLSHRRHGRPPGGVLPIIGVIFGLGLGVGAILRTPSAPSYWTAMDRLPLAGGRSSADVFSSQVTYSAEVLRVIDGDTFAARLRVWRGFDLDTKVRLRSIDAPELHARCASEYLKAEAARAALQSILAAGGVTVSHVGADKYRGRIDADVATRDTADVSAAMLKGGWARSYDGGRRGSWC